MTLDPCGIFFVKKSHIHPSSFYFCATISDWNHVLHIYYLIIIRMTK